MKIELSCSDLSVDFGNIRILHNLTAAFPPGALSCVLGANGAGKTTLLRALAGYLPCATGQVVIGERDIRELSSSERAKLVSVVPQLAPPTIPLTVFEAVALGRHPYSRRLNRLSYQDKAAISDVLSLLEIDALANQCCEQLSGGEWRKVLIAQGLVQDTPVIMLDEPTAFLDPPAQHQILQLLRQHVKLRGTSVIAVLHDPFLARNYADYVVLLTEGKLLASGTPETTLTTQLLGQLYPGPTTWLHDEVASQ